MRVDAAAAGAVQLTAEQIRDRVSTLWVAKFFEGSGHAAAGSHVFMSKHCTICHDDASSGAPHLPAPRADFTAASMVSALWRHGPRMLDLMKTKVIERPCFGAAGQTLSAIYERNVFTDLKVTLVTYPNNLGHTDYPGCFRCHDESHLTADKKTITQTDILKTLELAPTHNH